MKSAFNALVSKDNLESGLRQDCEDRVAEVAKIRQVIAAVRPHYDHSKIDALMKIIDPDNNGRGVTFRDFQDGIQKILLMSLRSARRESRESILLSSLTFFVAISNLVYVLLLSSPFEFLQLSELIFPVGTMIGFLGLAEVIIRLRPCSCLSTLSTARHSMLDGLAIFAALISLTGSTMHIVNESKGLQWLLFGRAVGEFRVEQNYN